MEITANGYRWALQNINQYQELRFLVLLLLGDNSL
jgi:hypothetical protein